MFIFGNQHLKLWYIVDLITFLLFVSEFIINIQLKYLSQEEIFTSQEATINNELKPILNLSLPDSSTGNCNEGSKLICWKFPGIYSACKMPNGTLLEGECTEDQLKLQYTNIQVNETELTKWRGKEICYTTSQYDYATLLSNSIEQSDNMKYCGILDNNKEKMFVPKEDLCPINSIKISNTKPDETYQSIQIDENLYLCFSREFPEQNIIVDIKLSDDKNVCFNPNEYNIGNMNTSSFDIEGKYKCNKYVNTTYDTRYELIDSISKYTLYNDNGLYDKLKDIPEYSKEKLDSITTSLFVRNYNGFNKTTFLQMGKQFDVYKDNILIFLLSCHMKYCLFIFYLFRIFIFILMSTLKLIFEGHKHHHNLYGILTIILCLFPFSICLMTYLYIKNVSMEGIGDTLTNPIYKVMQDVINRNTTVYLILMLMPIAPIVMFFIDLPIGMIRGKEEDEGEYKKVKK